MIKHLNEKDIDQILLVEKNAFIPPLQATRKIIKKRFCRGNKMKGVFFKGNLCGYIAYRAGFFNPLARSLFPSTFDDFSTHISCTHNRSNSTFVYSLGVLPEMRGKHIAKKLIYSVVNESVTNELEFVVGDGRVPSYNGSAKYHQENIPQNMLVKSEINSCMKNNSLPNLDIMRLDPIMNLYLSVLDNLLFSWIIPEFIPQDEGSGGLRIIMYKTLHYKSGLIK